MLFRSSRFRVEDVGPQLDADALHPIERVSQQQQLGFRVERRSLKGAAEPGPADFGAAMLAVDVCEPRAADGAAGGSIDDGERKRGPGALPTERGVDVRVQISERMNLGWRKAPQLRIECDLRQVGGVVPSERLETDRKSTRLNSSHIQKSRMPSSA